MSNMKQHPLQVLPVMKDPNKPKYRETHENLLSPPFRLAVIGSSKSGKSNYVVNLLRPSYYGAGKGVKSCFDKIYIFSPNLGMDETTRCFKKLCQEQDIKQDYNDSYIKNIIDYQKAHEGNEDKVLIIADDLIALGAQPQAKIFTSASYLRHLNCSIIYISQTYKGHYSLPPVVRNNLCGCVMFKCPSAQQIKSFCEDMAGTFGSKKNVENMLEYATREPYQFGFFNYRDLNVWKNHTQHLWQKYTNDGKFAPDFREPSEEEDYTSESEDDEK